MDNSFALTEKVICIAGLASEGRVCALRFAFANAHIVALDKSRNALDSLSSEISGKGHTFICLENSTDEEIAETIKKLPILNGVVIFPSCIDFAEPLIKSDRFSPDLTVVFAAKNMTDVDRKNCSIKSIARTNFVVTEGKVSSDMLEAVADAAQFFLSKAGKFASDAVIRLRL